MDIFAAPIVYSKEYTYVYIRNANMTYATHTYDQIFKAIESLLRTSDHCGHLVSVVDEAKKYCYKTFDGVIGIVDKDFIHDRIYSLGIK